MNNKELINKAFRGIMDGLWKWGWDTPLIDVPKSADDIPDPLMSQFEKNENGLFALKEDYLKSYADCLKSYANFASWTSYRFSFTTLPPPWGKWDNETIPEDTEPFEVNLAEALIGWKTWEIEEHEEKKGLFSCSFSGSQWLPNIPLVAACQGRPQATFSNPCAPDVPGCKNIPAEHHTCGIYAATERPTAEGYIEKEESSSHILGLVYGWGRYVRGDNGWRSQYAYPKCFYLKDGQMEHFEFLKEFHVPIYVEKPILFYNPEEDGYEYRRTEENWNSGTVEESFTDQEDDWDSEED